MYGQRFCVHRSRTIKTESNTKVLHFHENVYTLQIGLHVKRDITECDCDVHVNTHSLPT